MFFFEFIERITKAYPEVYNGGTSEGTQASDFFGKWGWYDTLNTLAKGKPWKYKFIEEWNVHEMHVFLAHKIDKQKLKAQLRNKK